MLLVVFTIAVLTALATTLRQARRGNATAVDWFPVTRHPAPAQRPLTHAAPLPARSHQPARHRTHPEAIDLEIAGRDRIWLIGPNTENLRVVAQSLTQHGYRLETEHHATGIVQHLYTASG